MSAVVTEVRDDQQTLQSRTRVEYDYDDRGLRVESRELTDTNLDGSFDRLDATTKYLVDHDNHTGYQQVIRETRTDEQTGESTVIDYSFGHDEITQTTRQYDDQGAQVSDETLTFTHDGSGSVRALLNAVGAIASIVSIEQIF